MLGRLAMVVAALSLAGPARARAVAVLPFEAGAKSDAYDGLGRALAGMLVSDLSKAPGVELVERDQLDALLAEVKLGDGGYLDPATAARLGKGVGAEWVVVGSFSVVGQQFLLDGRAVDVGSGKILAATDAQGTVGDFVTVEKELVEELLDGLKVALSAGARRQILADAPTEDFQAVASYGAGLQAEFEGDVVEARKRYQDAVQRDPAFDLPQQRIASLRVKLEQIERDRVAARKDQRTLDLEAALAKTPTEMDQKGPTSSDAEAARYGLRFALLRELGRRCQGFEEMTHYLDRHQGRLASRAKHPGPYNDRIREGHALGLVGEPYPWDHGVLHVPREGYEHLVTMEGPTVGHPGPFVVGTVDGPDRAAEIGESLINEAIACAGDEPGARVKAIEGVVAQVERWKLGDITTWSNGAMPIRVELEVMLLQALADRDGMTAEVSARVDALLALELPSDEKYSIQVDAGTIARIAANRERRVATMRGTTPDQVLAIQRGWASKDANVLLVGRPECAVFVEERAVEQAGKALERLEKDFPGGVPTDKAWYAVLSAAGEQAVPDVMGCLAGRPGAITTLAEAVAWLDTADARLRPGRDEKACAEALAEARKSAASYAAIPNSPPGLYASILVRTIVHRLVNPGCVALR